MTTVAVSMASHNFVLFHYMSIVARNENRGDNRGIVPVVAVLVRLVLFEDPSGGELLPLAGATENEGLGILPVILALLYVCGQDEPTHVENAVDPVSVELLDTSGPTGTTRVRIETGHTDESVQQAVSKVTSDGRNHRIYEYP